MSANAGFTTLYNATLEAIDPWMSSRRGPTSSIVANYSAIPPLPSQDDFELPRKPRTRRISAPAPPSDDDSDEDMDWTDDGFGAGEVEEEEEDIELNDYNEFEPCNLDFPLSDEEI